MWSVKYINHTDNDKVCTETVDDKDLESMFHYDAGGVITLKHWEEITMKIQVMMMNVDFKKVYEKISFTGHRPDKLGGYKAGRNSETRVMIRQKLREVCDYFILNCGTTAFMQGMAQGVDQDAADVILEIMEQMVHESDGTAYVELHAAIPYKGQEKMWPESAQQYYYNMIDTIKDYHHMGSEVHYVYDTTPPSSWAAVKWLDDRNHYMIDWCDLLIAVWDGTKGGTNNAIEYAKKKGKPILLLRLVA